MSDDLPNGWTLTTIGDVCASKVVQRSPEQDFLYIDIGSVDNQRKQIIEPSRLAANSAPSRARQVLREGDILVSLTRPNLNAVAMVPSDLDGSIGSTGFDVLRAVGCDTRWLFAFVRGPAFVARMSGLVQGALYPAVRSRDVRETAFPLPPLNEQRRIVAKLEALQARSRRAREALDAVPPLLEKLRQSILAAAFAGTLTADWRAKHKYVEPASELLKRIRTERRKKWEEAELAKLKAKGRPPTDDKWKSKYKEPAPVDTTGLPELPQAWCWASVADLSELQLGQQRAPIHADAEVQHPYVRAANITWRGLELADVKRMGFPDLERYSLNVGDVLLSEASGSATEVGKPAIWRGEIPGCCYQKTLLRARPHPGVRSEWLHLAFLADALLGRFARMAPGVGILHLTADRMFAWPVAVAPDREQSVVLERATNALNTVARLEDRLGVVRAQLDELERSVLAKAFRGELVPQDAAEAAALARLPDPSDADGEPPVHATAVSSAPRRKRKAS